MESEKCSNDVFIPVKLTPLSRRIIGKKIVKGLIVNHFDEYPFLAYNIHENPGNATIKCLLCITIKCPVSRNEPDDVTEMLQFLQVSWP